MTFGESQGNFNYLTFPLGELNYVIYIGEVENSNFFQWGVVLQARFSQGNSPGWIQLGAVKQGVSEKGKNIFAFFFFSFFCVSFRICVYKVITN